MSALDSTPTGALTRIAAVIDGLATRKAPTLLRVWTDGEIVAVFPWLDRRPVTALLAWADLLTGPTYRAGYAEGFGVVLLIATGTLDGVPVEAQVHAAPANPVGIAYARDGQLVITRAELDRAAAAETAPDPATAPGPWTTGATA